MLSSRFYLEFKYAYLQCHYVYTLFVVFDVISIIHFSCNSKGLQIITNNTVRKKINDKPKTWYYTDTRIWFLNIIRVINIIKTKYIALNGRSKHSRTDEFRFRDNNFLRQRRLIIILQSNVINGQSKWLLFLSDDKIFLTNDNNILIVVW